MNDPFYELYKIIVNYYQNSNYNLVKVFFPNLGDNDPEKLITDFLRDDKTHEDGYLDLKKKKILFHDQEPIMYLNLKNNWAKKIQYYNKLETNHILSNSEKNSDDKNELLKESGWHDLYWFSNGFLSLEWYRFFRYATFLENNWEPTKIFSSYNRILPNREHRIIVAGHLLNNFAKKSIVSCHSVQQKIRKNFPINQLKCIEYITSDVYNNIEKSTNLNQSFNINIEDFIDSFCHVVTERIFYESRIHLTEKIFRPIICCRPFIVVSSKGALS